MAGEHTPPEVATMVAEFQARIVTDVLARMSDSDYAMLIQNMNAIRDAIQTARERVAGV